MKQVLFPSYSTHTGLSFPPDYKHPEGRHQAVEAAQHSNPHMDQLPSSPLCSTVSVAAVESFPIQKQKLMDLSEGRTDPCTFTQETKDCSFSMVFRGELGMEKYRARTAYISVSGWPGAPSSVSMSACS